MSEPKPMMSETSAWRTDGNGAPVTSTRGMYSEQMVEATLARVLAMHETELGEHVDVARWSLELPLSVDTEPHSRAWHLAWSGTVAGLRIEVEASESNLAQTWTITEVRVVRLERSGRLSPRDLEVGFEARTEAEVRAGAESRFERELARRKPMDPERLALLRELLKYPSPDIANASINADGGGDVFHLVDELLLDRDHWEAEANFWQKSARGSRDLREDMELRMMRAEAEAEDARAEAKRSRSPVTSEDVEVLEVLAMTKRLGEELEGLRADRDEAVAKLRVVVAGQAEALDKLGRSWQSRLDAEQAKTKLWRARAESTVLASVLDALEDPSRPEESPVDAVRRLLAELDQARRERDAAKAERFEVKARESFLIFQRDRAFLLVCETQTEYDTPEGYARANCLGYLYPDEGTSGDGGGYGSGGG